MYECVTGEKPPEVLERLHAGLGKPLSEGKWPGYSKKFLAAIDAAMTVKPDERPQSLGDWLEMFGKKAELGEDEGDDEATRFFAGQVQAEDIVPVPPTPNLDPKAPVETGVPDDPKEAKFKLAGEETGAKKRIAAKKKAGEPAAAGTAPDADSEAAAEPEAPLAASRTAKAGEAAEKKKPSPAMLAAAAVGVLAIVGVGALTLRGGNSQPEAAASDVPAGISPGSLINMDAAQPVNAIGNEAQVAGGAETGQQPGEDSAASEALRSEKAKAAAAEAQLAAMRKAAARAAAGQTASGAATAAKAKTNGKTAAPTQTASSASESGGGVSPAKLSQFYSIVDDARSMAKKVIRKGSSQNAALARSYDANLKTLKDSGRGIQSDKEADRLIKQANQTRAYVQFLYQQL